MSEHDFIAGQDSSASSEPAVHHPGLQVLVKAARTQTTPRVLVSAETIHEGWQQHRATQRRGLVTGLALAAALVITVTALGPQLWDRASDGPVVPGDATVTPVAAADTTSVEPAPRDTASSPIGPEAPTLIASIHVVPLEPTDARPEVLGSRHLRLPDGSWSIDSEAPEPVTVDLPDGPLELRGGAIHAVVAGDVARVEVLREQVERMEASGRRRVMPVEARPGSESDESTHTAGLSAAALAREAEERMATGDRQGAIRSLRRLVTQHGRSAAAQAGLIDLGRLLKAVGQTDEARCAYASFLERWPGHALAGDVTRAKRALGNGPTCNELRPRPQD